MPHTVCARERLMDVATDTAAEKFVLFTQPG